MSYHDYIKGSEVRQKMKTLLRRIWNIDKDEQVQKVWLVSLLTLVGIFFLWWIGMIITDGRIAPF